MSVWQLMAHHCPFETDVPTFCRIVGWRDGCAFWVLTRTTAWGLLRRLRHSWGVRRALHRRCLLPSEGGCLGQARANAVCVQGSLCRECHHFRKGMGGPSLTHFFLCAGLSSAEACLRVGHVWDTCGTCKSSHFDNTVFE